MSSVTQMARLFQNLAKGDLESAIKVAHQIADERERRGQRSAAQTLRGSLIPNGSSARTTASREENQSALPLSLFVREPEGPSFADVQLRGPTRQLLAQLVEEWEYRTALAQNSICRRSKLLLWGPPGCGKTLTARALGHELSMPVFTARLSNIIGAYLGQTGSNLRQLFAFAQATPCILLLDEFDALGRSRGRPDDVGELDRVLISLLQELDHTSPSGFVIAATNLPESLDRALWRRFDVSIEFPTPSTDEIRLFARERLKTLDLLDQTELLEILVAQRTYAEIDQKIEDFRRRKIIAEARK
jgi:SpoVK/Ycf46/Vps4 family AAA+-type ATPase